ncbi:golgin subfamily A member 3 isoform X2 [Parasteatoda tepidariorum]|nr:golgin subfamily A member 3 isoform X2 [Parasteatoda tepidariorum]
MEKNTPVSPVNSQKAIDSVQMIDSVEQSSYPTIPIAVAHVINQNNPEIFKEAGRYFSSGNFKRLSDANDLVSQSITNFSPLHSMSATSEALALQQSVIGNLDVKPVSVDIVAQVVANTRLQLEKKELTHPISVDTENESSPVTEQNFSTLENINPENTPKTELIRYPSDIISSTVEKRSWFSSSSSFETPSDNLPKMNLNQSLIKNHSHSRSSSQSSINSISFKKSMRTNVSDLPRVHSSKNSKLQKLPHFINPDSPYERYPDSSNDYETESSVYDLESLCSEAFETESNFSEISGVDDEIFQIRKVSHNSKGVFNESDLERNYFIPSSQNGIVKKNANTSPLKSSISLTCDKATETDETNFQLLREKANLEGRLESVTKEQRDLIKERDYYQSLATSYEAQVKSLQGQLEATTVEKKNALILYDSQTKEHNNWDNIIKEYQNIIETKNVEIKALKDDLSESEQANTRTRIGCEELKVDMDSRDAAIAGLKKKIAELHVEVQIHLQGKIQLENEVKNVRLEMETLQKSKDWFQEQLHSTQENRNKLHQQLIFTQNELSGLGSKLESALSEKSQLKLELSHLQQRAVAEKEILMKRLETIEADMKERESLFDEIQKDKGSAEDSLIERIRKMEEEKSNLMALSFTVSDQEYQLKSLTGQCEEKSNYIQSLEKDKAELNKQIAILQKTSYDKDIEVQQLKQNVKDVNIKITHLETALRHSDEVINTLKDERTATDVALAAANEEKRIVNESLKTVSENLNKFQSNFKHMKTELISQTSRAEQLLKEKTLMEEVIRKHNDNTQLLRQEYEQKILCETQNQGVLLDDMLKKKSDVESVLTVYSKDLLNYQQLVEKLTNEKSNLVSNISEMELLVKNAEAKVQTLNEENASLKKELVIFEKEQNVCQVKYVNNGVENSELPTPEAINVKKASKSKSLLYKKLKEKIKECKVLKDELEELRSTLAESVPCDNCASIDLNQDKIASSERRIVELEHQLNQQSELLEEKIALLKKSEDTIIELEKEKGKAIGFVDKYEILKQHMTEVEQKLSEKESSVVQLTCSVEDLRRQLSEMEENTKNQIFTLESDLKKEKAWVKDLRNQVTKEERANSHLQRDVLTLKSGLEQANQHADAKKLDISTLQAELSLKVQAELKHRAELEHLQTEIHLQHSIVDKLKKELEEVKARDPALAEQLKALSWRVKEKTNEAEALREKLKLIEERYQSEVSTLKKNMQETEVMLNNIKKELNETRKEKFSYQSRVIELRKALKSKLVELESKGILKVENKSSSSGPIIHLNIPDPESTFDEQYVNDLLQKSMKLTESRPLSNLQDCLNSLKEEMMNLQQKIIDSVDND